MDTGEPSSDPTLLLTPKKLKEPPVDPEPVEKDVKLVQQQELSRGTRNPFFVAVPCLSAEKKTLYRSPRAGLLDVIALSVDEVIGEYSEDKELYYYARYQGGPAYKFLSGPFRKKNQNLVDEFNNKKAAKQLAPFDPSASYIHPSSRVKMVIRIIKPRSISNMPSSRSAGSVSKVELVSEEEEEEGGTAVDDDASFKESDYEDDAAAITRRTRAHGRRKKILPFSPRKTRSRKILIVDSDFDDDGSQDSIILEPSQRPTRVRKGVKVKLDADSYSEAAGTSEDGSKAYVPQTKHPRKSQSSAKPAYGYFRSITELDYDTTSDEESVPLRKHRNMCEKCHQAPAHELLKKLAKSKTRKKKRATEDEFDSSGDEKDKIVAFGGWVRCLKCPVVAHWKCIAGNQKDEILRAVRVRDLAEVQQTQYEPGQQGEEDMKQPTPKKRSGLEINLTTEFICSACTKGGFCMGCMEPAPGIHQESGVTETTDDRGDEMNKHQSATSDTVAESRSTASPSPRHLLFRCLTCKRPSHYEHLPPPSGHSLGMNLTETALYYTGSWLCADCISFTFAVDKIVAWRPYPPGAEGMSLEDAALDYKRSLPREYLIKWQDRSYRRVQWVPHMWLLSTHPAKLKNFLAGGSKVELLKTVDDVLASDTHIPPFEVGEDSRASSVKLGTVTPPSSQDAVPDAEHRIPLNWKTIDRVLDVLLWYPRRERTKADKKKVKRYRRASKIQSDLSELSELEDDDELERDLAFTRGEQPSDNLVETVSDWEARTKSKFNLENIDRVVWLFIKWQDLGYEESTWDSPPRSTDPTYPAFQEALRKFIDSRRVIVPIQDASFRRTFDKRAKDEYWARHRLKDAADLDIGQDRDLKLMPFQVDGFNWLCNNWWTHQHCILADEMGLGKTVQIATFLGKIAESFKASPALVVVPNSTITNWVRELERWAPKLRVVPFYGEAKARDIIKRFELYHTTKRLGETRAKFHVLVTTYETLLNQKDFTPVFRNQPRWEVLIVDEGQRLKSDSSLLFRRLNELNSVHRIIMTGTPLNNNIRELFNLMNFLDPNEWNDLQSLEKEHEELTEELVKQLHNRLRPYFLRRLKTEVLQLPPKNEVIVPVSMAPLQKEVYRSILSRNLEVLHGLAQQSSKPNGAPLKGRLNNVLMELRKCLQHPYLNATDLEPRGLSPQEAHGKLIDGSAKLRLLKFLLPKLKERGHRVLLFSQFVIALDIIEDFLVGEGYKYLRMDGNTKGGERQKGMDEFNKHNSEVFIYLLTTRAGGVGINLYTADTVIIFDPDFNPHQDLQAIARAYRFGQKKTCLVFKLIVKDSAEERIMQVGKKKLALDHLIVQKMDEADSVGEDVQSILTYGAKALFDEDQHSRDIAYSEQDIAKLVEKTEQEGDEPEQVKEGMSFAFAKVWAADKDALQEVEDIDETDSWAQTLQKITQEREKTRSEEIALSGRGVKRRAAAISKPNMYKDKTYEDIAGKQATPAKSVASDGSGYVISDIESDEDDRLSDGVDETFELDMRKAKATSAPQNTPQFADRSRYLIDSDLASEQYCGLCGNIHDDGSGECIMTERSENLVEFREMLLLHADDEPWEERKAAIDAIDRTLHKRGHIRLIIGQPLHLLRRPDVGVVAQQPIPVTSPMAYPNHQQTRSTHFVNEQDMQNQPIVDTTAGPSKRPASPTTAEERELKKIKKPDMNAPTLPCPVCQRVPHHLVKDCPVVAEGPRSISRQILRLEASSDPSTIATVRVLRQLLVKQTKRDIPISNNN